MAEHLTRIANDHLTVFVDALGAETHRITTAGGEDLLWQGDAAWWAGRAPLLFPIVGAAPQDRIAFGGFEAGMPKHGFARRSTFELGEVGDLSCTHVLRDSAATRAMFPFGFRLSVTHALVDACLQVTAVVENLDGQEMPFGFGFHPAFLWPLPGAAGKAHQIQLDNSAEPALARIGADGLLKPEVLASPYVAGKLTLAHEMFDEDAMLFPKGAGEGLSYGAEGGPVLRFAFDNLPNLALWQKPGAPFLCIEPWHGMAARVGASAQMTDRPDSVVLGAGQRVAFGWQVSLV